ncbi:hypothetical protein [Micromonospora haikouensis]|uniref:hypothetical protein n=1 Tax=Micromonospora haikouensis TaxID=686309 RepID=UPI0037A930D3
MGSDDVLMPVHAVGLVAMGLRLLDNCDLEACATTVAALGQWDCHLAVAPVRFAGTSGSPVDPSPPSDRMLCPGTARARIAQAGRPNSR